jgi:peptide deformylase
MQSPIKAALEEARWVTENLPIRLLGDPILVTPCRPVTKKEIADGTARELADNLSSFLQKYRDKTGVGRGLAANQIGVSKQMALVWLDSGPEVFINPEVVSTEGEGIYPESCISAASLVIGEVIRPWQAKVRYTTLKGEKKTIDADPIHTRLLLHEIDHLQGQVCTDKYKTGTTRLTGGDTDEILKPELKRLK